MDLNQIGFSNIRLPNDPNNYMYIYHPNINTFPEEVFLHEFLHSLERTLIEYGYKIPALHDNLIYGYEEEGLNGLKNWYKDYMRCNIYDEKNNKYIGLDPIIYNLQPTKQTNFEYTMEIEFNDEPDNFLEEILKIITNIINSFNNKNNDEETYNINDINNTINEGNPNESI